MVEGKTKSGIEFKLNEAIKDDARFLYYLSKFQNKDIPVEEQSKNLMGMLALIFGDDEGVINFMNAVASKNKGVCDVKTMLKEMSEMFDALNIKN